MCKRNNVEMALNIASESKTSLRRYGNYWRVFYHETYMMNLESVITYEGTPHDIHLLITGLDITGENVFK